MISEKVCVVCDSCEKAFFHYISERGKARYKELGQAVNCSEAEYLDLYFAKWQNPNDMMVFGAGFHNRDQEIKDFSDALFQKECGDQEKKLEITADAVFVAEAHTQFDGLRNRIRVLEVELKRFEEVESTKRGKE